MLKLLVLLFLVACSTPEDEVGPRSVEPQVAKTVEDVSGHRYQDLQVDYSLPHQGCEIRWRIIRNINTQGKRYTLDLRSGDLCEKSFSQLRPTHEAVLKRMFKDFKPELVGHVSTGGLISLDGSGAWNLKIAEASLKSPDWLDYAKHYPKHASKKSSNDIFLELLHQVKPHAPFQEMLDQFGLQFEVYHVEKVFTQKTKSGREIRDVGVMWWDTVHSS